MNILIFSWKKLGLLCLLNIFISALFFYAYQYNQHVLSLMGLMLTGFISTATYLIMINSISPKAYVYKIPIFFIALTPFLSLPLIAYLKNPIEKINNPGFSKYKMLLLTAGSLVALTMSLKTTQYLKKTELLAARLLPPELSFVILSSAESSRVSALSPYETITTPIAISAVQELRKKYHPDFSSNLGINPNAIFKVLPLGFAWIRGAPIHSMLLLHYHYLQRR